MISTAIQQLVNYGLDTGLILPDDEIYIRNQLLMTMQLDDFTAPEGEVCYTDLESILKTLVDDAVARGVCEDNSTARDLFDTKLMGVLTPRPSIVRANFEERYENEGPQAATDWFYKFSQDTDYIRRYRIKRDLKWVTKTAYGDLDITINLSKPEKDPKAIAAARQCAVLLVMHSNKKQGVSGRARLADSSDIWDMARSVLMMGRAKNDGKIYLSHEKNSYARLQQTVLLHIDDVEVEGVKTARAVFDGYTDKKDADFIEERRVRTAETRQDTRSAILNVLSESRLGSMPSNELRAAVLREIGCSDSTYNRVYSDLTKSSQIAKQAIRGKDGRNRWYTCYCGETSDKVPF